MFEQAKIEEAMAKARSVKLNTVPPASCEIRALERLSPEVEVLPMLTAQRTAGEFALGLQPTLEVGQVGALVRKMVETGGGSFGCVAPATLNIANSDRKHGPKSTPKV